jgi:hypothetical protein
MKVLVLFAHPAFQKSKANKILADGLSEVEGITFHDLYQEYPELDINVKREQELLEEHDVLGVYREFSDVALRMAADALGHMGYRKNQVHRSLKMFRRHYEAYLKEMAQSRLEHKTFIKRGRQVIEELELMMLEDIEKEAKDKDLGWDTETILEEFAPIMRQLKEEKK